MKKQKILFWYKDEQPPKKGTIVIDVWGEKFKVIKREDRGRKYLITFESETDWKPYGE